MDAFASVLRKKFFTNFNLDFTFLSSRGLGTSEKISFLFRKYFSVLANRRSILYLGKRFFYDNRFVPAILEVYPSEIYELGRKVPLKELKTVLDIGANIGQFSFTLKSLYPHLSVYAFEPNIQSFSILKKNIGSFDNVLLFNYGIAKKSGKRVFYYSPSASAEGSFFRENLNQNYERKDVQKVSINVTALGKNSLKKMNLPCKFDLVKIDVEGAEMEVLASLKKIEFRYLQIEVSLNRKVGGNLDAVSRMIEKMKGVKPQLISYHLPSKDSPAANALFKI